MDGFFDEGAVWSPATIACLAMVEQLGLFVACWCYLNGSPLHNEPVAVKHGDFLAIFKSDHTQSDALGHAMLSTASTRDQKRMRIACAAAVSLSCHLVALIRLFLPRCMLCLCS